VKILLTLGMTNGRHFPPEIYIDGVQRRRIKYSLLLFLERCF